MTIVYVVKYVRNDGEQTLVRAFEDSNRAFDYRQRLENVIPDDDVSKGGYTVESVYFVKGSS